MQEGSGRNAAFLLAIILFSVFAVHLVLQGDADFAEATGLPHDCAMYPPRVARCSPSTLGAAPGASRLLPSDTLLATNCFACGETDENVLFKGHVPF